MRKRLLAALAFLRDRVTTHPRIGTTEAEDRILAALEEPSATTTELLVPLSLVQDEAHRLFLESLSWTLVGLPSERAEYFTEALSERLLSQRERLAVSGNEVEVVD